MIHWILLFVGLLLVGAWLFIPSPEPIYQCGKCGIRYVTLLNSCPSCGGEILNRFRREETDFVFDDPYGGMKHNVNCGCRLCYKNPTDFRDLKEYNWWDFHDTSGQQVYAGGTLPTFGLWRNKNDLRAPHCLKAKFDWRFNSPCTNPWDLSQIPDYPFPAECDKTGRCRIRGVFEDSIKYI